MDAQTINVIPADYEPPKDNFPFKSPFYLSSAEAYWCMGDSARIVYIKRRHLEENIKTFEQEIGMDDTERKRFLDYWCCPDPGNPSEIRAEGDRYFNIRQRAESWMGRRKGPTETKTQQSRIEQYAEKSRRAAAILDQLYPEDVRGAVTGSADAPDEQ